MPTVNVVFGKSAKPAKFYHKGKRISVDTAFGMYQKKGRFVANGKALNVNRFGATDDDDNLCSVCMDASGVTHGCCQTRTCHECKDRIVQSEIHRCPGCRKSWGEIHGQREAALAGVLTAGVAAGNITGAQQTQILAMLRAHQSGAANRSGQ